MLTVYLTGEADAEVVRRTESDEVLFLGYDSRKVSGLKLGAIRKLRHIAAGRDFALCLTHRAKPTYIALLATALPVISLHHNYGDFKRWGRRLLVDLFRHRLLLLGVSDSVRDEMRAHLPGWPAHKIQTLHNHIDVAAVQAEQLPRAQARAALQLPAQGWIVGNVGRLHRDKDQATLIRGFHAALPRLPEGSLLVIMGSGPLQEQLQALVASLGLQGQVRLVGNVSDARRYFKAFDVFALTSDHEPFGMVLLEAMAARLPLICSDSGGGAEVVRDHGGLFATGDHAQLAQVLVQYAQKREVRAVPEQWLRQRFSDEAARARFLELEFVKRVARQNTAAPGA